MIDIENLEFAYRQSSFVLRIPSFQIADGEQVAIVGPSGSGKTTLLNLIAGIVLADSGKVMVGEDDVAKLSDSRRRQLRVSKIGMVFQEFELLDYLNVRDNCLLPYRIHQALKIDQQVLERLEEYADSLGIQNKLKRPVRQLSQGERQRVAICRALLTKPKLVLADEPTGNLDPTNKQRIVDLLVEQSRQCGASLLAVTHDHSLLSRFDRTIDLASLAEATTV